MPINSFLYPGAKFTPAYEVANSLRFNRGSADHLTRSVSGSSTTKATYSVWFKKTINGVEQCLYAIDDGTNEVRINFTTSDTIQVFHYASGYTYQIATNRVFRDCSAFYNIMIVVDTTQGTDTNRVKIYVNGVQETSLATTNYPSQNTDSFFFQSATLYLGVEENGSSNPIDGYIAEHIVCQGQALIPTDVGEFDSDTNIWKPIDVSGLTFGTNGFYLDFENASSLGADVSGNGNNFTVNNLTSIDQSTDTCTNNFCVINSLDNYFASSDFSEGNLKVSTDSSNYSFSRGTIGVSSGKWYFEHKIVTQVSDHLIGIVSKASTSTTDWIGLTADTWGWITNGSNKSELSNNNSRTDVSSSGGYPTDGDIIGVYIDLDNNKLYFAKNGTLVSSTGQSLTASASTTDGFYYPAAGDFTTNTNVMEFNFGGGSVSAISSGNSDPNGYGNFEYSTTITGDGSSKSFYAICTKNLAEFG